MWRDEINVGKFEPDPLDKTTSRVTLWVHEQKARPDPVTHFWSVIVYDTQTRSMLQTDQRFPSVSSQNRDLQINTDGSVDVWFGPEAPAGKESNWVQTIPGKGWFMILRLYGPLEPWFNKTWRPGEIELQP